MIVADPYMGTRGLSRGGRHDWENLAVVCLACNTRKHARMPTATQVRAAERQRAQVSGQLPLLVA